MSNDDKLESEVIDILKAVATLGQRNKKAILAKSPNIAKEIIRLVRDSECERKAKLWDAFTSNQRIRTLGWVKLGEKGYQHIGFEIWTQYGTETDNKDPDYRQKFIDEKETSLRNLEIYLDAWMQTPIHKQP